MKSKERALQTPRVPITRSGGRQACRRDRRTDRPVLRVFSTVDWAIWQARSLQAGRKDRRAGGGMAGPHFGFGPGTPGCRPCASGGFRWEAQRKRPLGSGPGSQLHVPSVPRSRTALTTVSRPRRARSPAFGASPRVQAIPADVGAGAGSVSHHLAGRQADTTHPAGFDDGWPCRSEGQTLVISHDQLPSGTNRRDPGSPVVRVRCHDAFLPLQSARARRLGSRIPTVLPPNHSPINIR